MVLIIAKATVHARTFLAETTVFSGIWQPGRFFFTKPKPVVSCSPSGVRIKSNEILPAMKIHISAETKLLLDALGGFRTEHRGLIELKFKGLVDTYWLLGKKQEKSKHIFPKCLRANHNSQLLEV